ncbi:MAG: hypothetical protein NDP22_01920 [Crenarchaeota archaeon]|nr:hypothetical protein [Thermoproteota archaeon]
MLPLAHLAVTYILWRILGIFFEADMISLALGITFGVLIDGDVILKGSKHRESIFHSFVLWFVLILLLYLLKIEYWWTALFGVAHIMLDMIDWDVYPFYPISKKALGLRILARKSKLIAGKNQLNEFVLEYVRNRYFVVSEILLGMTALITYIYL